MRQAYGAIQSDAGTKLNETSKSANQSSVFNDTQVSHNPPALVSPKVRTLPRVNRHHRVDPLVQGLPILRRQANDETKFLKELSQTVDLGHTVGFGPREGFR